MPSVILIRGWGTSVFHFREVGCGLTISFYKHLPLIPSGISSITLKNVTSSYWFFFFFALAQRSLLKFRPLKKYGTKGQSKAFS